MHAAAQHRNKLIERDEQQTAPAFQPRGQRPERLLRHVSEGSSSYKEAIVNPLLLLLICTTTTTTTTTNNLHTAMSIAQHIVIKAQNA